jgi:hypothetical protein
MDLKSLLGYSQNSPFKNDKKILIKGNNITMHNTAIPLWLQGMKNGKKVGKKIKANPFDTNPYIIPGADSVEETPMSNSNSDWEVVENNFQPGGTKMNVDSILNSNKNLDWVKRLYENNPASVQLPNEKYPSTHLLEQADNRVYPRLQMVNGKLTDLGNNAYNYADSTKSYIQFANDAEALKFTQNYKSGKGVLKSFQPGGIKTDFPTPLIDQKYAPGRATDIGLRAPLPIDINRDVEKVKENRKVANYQKLKSVGYTDKEAKALAQHTKLLPSAQDRINNLDIRNSRISKHPDYDPNKSFDEQVNLNSDNSLRTMILRGRNEFMSAKGVPILGDAAKMLVSPGSSFANMTMDAENQYIKPGLNQGLLNLGMDAMAIVPELQIKAANAASKIPRFLRETSKDISTSLPKFKDEMIDHFKRRYLGANEKRMAEVTKLNEKAFNNVTSEEGIRRLKNVGINPLTIEKNIDLTVDSFSGSHYSPWGTTTNKINIDYPQLSKLKKSGLELPQNSVYEHEYGHYLQDMLRKTKSMKEMNSKEKFKMMLRTRHEMDNVISDITPQYNKIGNNSYENYSYFKSGREAYPFMREMRQNMVNKGYINHPYDKISGRQIVKFIKENPKDRISSFININEKNIGLLKNVMNNFPAIIPAVGIAGVAASQQETSKERFKNGGKIFKNNSDWEIIN